MGSNAHRGLRPAPGATRRVAAAGLLALAASGQAMAQPLAFDGADVLSSRKDRTSRLTTPVYINGAGPFAFVIDTGANRSVISTELAQTLQLPAGPPARIHGIVSAQETPTVNVQSFVAGDVKLPLAGVPTLRQADLGCAGFLGIDAFHDKRVFFDFRKGEVAIVRPGVDDFRGGGKGVTLTSDVDVRARRRYGQLVILDADAVGGRLTCFVDSGAQRSVGNMAMRRSLQARTHDRDFAPISVMLYGATGQQVRGEVAEVPRLRIGMISFTDFPMAFADLHTFTLWDMQDRPALMMGMDLLGLFSAVIVDFRQNYVRFRIAATVHAQTAS